MVNRPIWFLGVLFVGCCTLGAGCPGHQPGDGGTVVSHCDEDGPQWRLIDDKDNNRWCLENKDDEDLTFQITRDGEELDQITVPAGETRYFGHFQYGNNVRIGVLDEGEVKQGSTQKKFKAFTYPEHGYTVEYDICAFNLDEALMKLLAIRNNIPVPGVTLIAELKITRVSDSVASVEQIVQDNWTHEIEVEVDQVVVGSTITGAGNPVITPICLGYSKVTCDNFSYNWTGTGPTHIEAENWKNVNQSRLRVLGFSD